MFDRLYRSTLAMAESPRAPQALALVAFAESSFFPIPPDVLLVPMAIAKPHRAFVYAAICTVASVLGGIVGYAIGALLYDTVGKWLIGLYGLGDRAHSLREFYAHAGAWVILIKGLTPIPFKLVTIVSGLMGYNFPLFVLLALVTRGARFFIEAALLTRFGKQIKALLDRHFAAVMVILLVTIALGFWIAAKFV